VRIATFGIGGVGGQFGAQLARSGEEVAFIAGGPHLGPYVKTDQAERCKRVINNLIKIA
jgi:ketopantoate reductase